MQEVKLTLNFIWTQMNADSKEKNQRFLRESASLLGLEKKLAPKINFGVSHVYGQSCGLCFGTIRMDVEAACCA